MYAIETYFIGPTNHRGARIVARVMERGTGWAGNHPQRRLILEWDHAKNPDANHRAAALALATKLGWSGAWFGGGSDSGATIWVNSDNAWGVSFNIEKDAATLERGPRPAHIAAVAGR